MSAEYTSALASDRAHAAVDRFAEHIRSISWFVAVGEPLLDAERSDAHRYLEALGLDSMEVAQAKDWTEAESIVRDPRWDRRWWDAEERARRSLVAEAGAAHGMGALMSVLSQVTNEATGIVLGMASTAALRAGTTRQAIAAVAAGAATQACYQAALALTADADDTHPFAIKRRLFEAGRWPLGVIDGVYYLF